MKNLTKIRIFLISLLLITFTACSDKGTNSNNVNDSLQSLAGTSWKLVGFINTETNLMKEAEIRNEKPEYYTLNFVSENKYNGFATANSFEGSYLTDFSTNIITISNHGTTKIYEQGDAYNYNSAFSLIQEQKFSVSKDSLKLYYENGSKYLLFEKK